MKNRLPTFFPFVLITLSFTLTSAACDLDSSGLVGYATGETNMIHQGDTVTFTELKQKGVVYVKNPGVGQICSGVLLKNNLVMTARHCISDADVDGNNYIWGAHYGLNDVYVAIDLVALYDTYDDNDPNHARPLRLRHYDPNQDVSSGLTGFNGIHADIAFIELARPLWPLGQSVPFSNEIYGGSFASYDDLEDSSNAVATCYGYGENGEIHGVALKAVLEIHDTYVEDQYIEMKGNANSQYLRAGDSGAPCFKDGKVMFITSRQGDTSTEAVGAIPPEQWLKLYYPVGKFNGYFVMAGFRDYNHFLEGGGNLRVKAVFDDFGYGSYNEWFWDMTEEDNNGNDFMLGPHRMFLNAYKNWQDAGFPGDFNDWSLGPLESGTFELAKPPETASYTITVEESPQSAFCRGSVQGAGKTVWNSGSNPKAREFDMTEAKVHCIEKGLAAAIVTM